MQPAVPPVGSHEAKRSAHGHAATPHSLNLDRVADFKGDPKCCVKCGKTGPLLCECGSGYVCCNELCKYQWHICKRHPGWLLVLPGSGHYAVRPEDGTKCNCVGRQGTILGKIALASAV